MPQPKISVVAYSEEFSEAHRKFASKMWPTKRRRREGAYQRWKFRGPSRGKVEGLLLALVGNTVLGQLGLIPATLRIGEDAYTCQWACDLMVDSSLRRKGVGTILLETAMARNVITLGSNPSTAADITMSRLGFRPLTGPRIMVLPRRLNQVLSWVMPPLLQKTIPSLSMIGQPVATFRSRTLNKTSASGNVTSNGWTSVMQLVESREQKIRHPHIVHDSSFMNWRCTGLDGYTIELETLRVGSSFAVVGPANQTYYVYEWDAGNKQEFLALFRGIYKRAARANCQTIEVLANEEFEEQWLRDVGFIGLRTRYKVVCYPTKNLIPDYEKFYYAIYDSDGNL